MINKAPDDPTTFCGHDRAEYLVLVFIQPLVDPLTHPVGLSGGKRFGKGGREKEPSKPPWLRSVS